MGGLRPTSGGCAQEYVAPNADYNIFVVQEAPDTQLTLPCRARPLGMLFGHPLDRLNACLEGNIRFAMSLAGILSSSYFLAGNGDSTVEQRAYF